MQSNQKHVRHAHTFLVALALLLFLGMHSYGVRAALINQSNVTVVNPVPTIRVEFDEAIIISHAVIYNTNLSRTFDATATAVNRSIVAVTPVQALPNGENILQLNVTDAVGNLLQYQLSFKVNAPLLTITLLKPRLGIASQGIFDITVKSTQATVAVATQCKYSLSNPSFDFNAPGLTLFDSNSNDLSEHTKAGFVGVVRNLPLGVPAILYVICKDNQGKIAQQRFDLYVDTNPPSIQTIGLDPFIISERSDAGTLQTVLTVIAANNDPVICKYGVDNSNYASMIPFANYNPLDFFSYTVQSNVTVKEFDAAQTLKDYSLYVQCEDRAGLLTGQEVRLVKVDLSQSLSITITSPKQYQSSALVELRLTTNKNANCLYGVDGASATQQMSPTSSQQPSKNHLAPLGNLAQGQHTVNILCSSGASGQFQTGEKSFTFTIDTTPPSVPTVGGPSITCTGNGFTFDPVLTLSATDAESGIDAYYYSLRGPQGLILNFTRSSGSLGSIGQDSSGNALNLTPKAAYTLSVKAVNNVGLESGTTSVSLQYDPTRSICLEKIPPSVTLRKSSDTTGTNITLICRDNDACDNSTFLYGTATAKDDCKATQKLAAPFAVTLYATQYFCYNVSDINKNSASGVERITVSIIVPPSCNDKLKNGNETDIDCAGNCQPCSIGKICGNNSDCLNGFCSSRKCTEASCTDRSKNQDESDVDCGGKCPQCANGKVCTFNSDCEGGYCTQGACSTPSCLDNIQNGRETDKDCGGTCPNCKEGMRCLTNSDCISNSCDFGFCSPEKPLPPLNETPGSSAVSQIGQKDTDGDGIPDTVEIQSGLNPNDPTDANLDLDGDGLTNLQEYQHKTSMTDKDTDGDGFLDGQEIEQGSDPLDPNSTPAKTSSGILTHIKKWIFLYLGLLLVILGIGYLAYNRYYKRPLEEKQRMRSASSSFFTSEKPMMPSQGELEAKRREEIAKRNQALMLQEKLRKERVQKEQEREKVFSEFDDEHIGKERQSSREENASLPQSQQTRSAKPARPGMIPPARQGAPAQPPAKGSSEEWIGLGEKQMSSQQKERQGDVFKELESLSGKKQPQPQEEDAFSALKRVTKRKAQVKPTQKKAPQKKAASAKTSAKRTTKRK